MTRNELMRQVREAPSLEDAVRLLVKAGENEATALFDAALERGEIDSDVVVVDD